MVVPVVVVVLVARQKEGKYVSGLQEPAKFAVNMAGFLHRSGLTPFRLSLLSFCAFSVVYFSLITYHLFGDLICAANVSAPCCLGVRNACLRSPAFLSRPLGRQPVCLQKTNNLPRRHTIAEAKRKSKVGLGRVWKSTLKRGVVSCPLALVFPERATLTWLALDDDPWRGGCSVSLWLSRIALRTICRESPPVFRLSPCPGRKMRYFRPPPVPLSPMNSPGGESITNGHDLTGAENHSPELPCGVISRFHGPRASLGTHLPEYKVP